MFPVVSSHANLQVHWTFMRLTIRLSIGALGVIAAIVDEVLDECIARAMVHYRWHYDENALPVLSRGGERKLQQSDLQDFEIYR